MIKIFLNIIKLFKQPSTISLLDHMGSGFFHALTLALLYRTLSTNDIGQWVLYLSLVMVFEFIRYGVTTIPLVRFLSSEKSEIKKTEISGSSWSIAISYTVIVALLVAAVGMFIDLESNYNLFFHWYPLYSICILPMHYCIANYQVKFRFVSIFLFRQISILPLLVYVVIAVTHDKSISAIDCVLVQLYSIMIASILGFVMNNTGIKLVRFSKIKTVKILVGFGKYNSLSGMVNHALRNTDLFLIGILMSSKELVIYSIPMKLIDIFEIMLAGLTAAAFPRMSACKDRKELADIFYFSTGISLVTLIPVLCLCYWQAGFFVELLAGKNYVLDDQATHLFRIFLLYAGFLAILRFSDICIDSLNKPKYNFKKSSIMVLTNIIGDLVAILIFDSLQGVAVVTFINILIGLYFSFYYFKRISDITIVGLFDFWASRIKSNRIFHISS